jgi:hypothetical protein
MIAPGLEWISNRDAYDGLVATAGQSNLMQGWAWGAAKAEVEGWTPRRAVIAQGGLVVASVQVLEKRLGPARIARINRGPLWQVDDLSDDDKRAVLQLLRRRWRWWRGSALLIAPELPQGSPLMAGFRPRKAPLWRSAWLDVAREPEILRKGLNGKWRNMLVNAEKADLTIEVMSGTHGVNWLLPRYGALMADKGFAATPPALLAALARHADADDVMTLVARDATGAEASAVLVVRHGAAATYLVGWNSDLGRKTRANHLLLWRAVLELEARGCRWFDLGGVDDGATPGVAAFKRGLGGTDYALAGEFIGF